jgi:hypothetical protein
MSILYIGDVYGVVYGDRSTGGGVYMDLYMTPSQSS